MQIFLGCPIHFLSCLRCGCVTCSLTPPEWHRFTTEPLSKRVRREHCTLSSHPAQGPAQPSSPLRSHPSQLKHYFLVLQETVPGPSGRRELCAPHHSWTDAHKLPCFVVTSQSWSLLDGKVSDSYFCVTTPYMSNCALPATDTPQVFRRISYCFGIRGLLIHTPTSCRNPDRDLIGGESCWLAERLKRSRGRRVYPCQSI